MSEPFDEMEYVPFSVRMEALAGKADSADLNAWMQRRFEAAWHAFDEAQLGRLSTISCGGDQADDAYRECLSAALAAWEAFTGQAPQLYVHSAPIDRATVNRLKKFQGRGGGGDGAP